MSVGENVKRIRKSKNLTQIELSELTGLGQNTISSIERGVNQPIQATLTVLASALGCTVAELLGEPKQKRRVLPDDELELLQIYRQLNQTGRDLLMKSAHSLIEEDALRQEGVIASAG